MTRQVIRLLLVAALFPAISAGEVKPRVDELQITDDGIYLRAGGYTFVLDDDDAALLQERDWTIRKDRIVVIVDGEETVLVFAVPDRLVPLPRRGDGERDRRRVEVNRFEDGVFIRFHQPGARDVRIEGSFTGWKRRPMERPEGDGDWVFRKRLRKGEYRFLIRYRLPEDDYWFTEPEREIRLTGERRPVYVIEVGDREVACHEEVVEENEIDGGFGGTYNRVEGLRLSYRIGLEHGRKRTARVEWSQAYSFAAERWSWNTTLHVPFLPVPGLSFEADGFDRVRVPLQWTVTENENLAAALLIKEDFYDYVWSRGYTVRLVERLGSHTLSAGFGVREEAPLSKNTDWSLFSDEKTFRRNLFADTAFVSGTTQRIEGGYVFDSRNYEDSPTRGWYLELHGDYAGWELGGDYDYWKGTADIRRFQKLSSRFSFDFRLLGGAIQATAPLQERFYLGGVGTMRAHDFKELVGNRFFLANLEYRTEIGNRMQLAFFTDLGDAWDTEERREFDLESDMGFGILDDDGDLRIDFARRLGREADDDLVVTLRLARMF